MIHSFELWKFSNKKYCLQKFIQKNFSSHHPSFKKDFQKFIKSLPNWNQSPSRHRALPFSSDSWEINWSFHLLVYLTPLPPAHFRWEAKLIFKVKITATTSYFMEDYFLTIPSWNSIKKWPYNGNYSLFIMTAISADPSLWKYHHNSAFYGHKSPNNTWPFLPHQMPLSKG